MPGIVVGAGVVVVVLGLGVVVLGKSELKAKHYQHKFLSSIIVFQVKLNIFSTLIFTKVCTFTVFSLIRICPK